MKDEIQTKLEATIKDLFGEKIKVELSRPEEQFGDFSTNIAMQLAKKLSKNTKEIAQKIVNKLDLEASVAGPGFINIR